MCGIVGILSSSTPPSRIIGRDMLSRLTHRGPDQGFIFYTEKVFLGLRRLSIVHPHGGFQPAFSNDGSIVAIFNGEIFNHLEVREELESNGINIGTGSDGEIIPHAYKYWGLDFVHHLNGQFAIVIWDQNREELLLIRDRVGIRPLFYCHIGGQLLFSSEVKAFLSHKQFSVEPNINTIAEIFSFWTPIDTKTVFKGVHQVGAGYINRFGKDGKLLNSHRYWDIPGSNVEQYETFEESKSALNKALRSSIRLQLKSDVAVGTYTSGGLDSSVINFLVREEIGQENIQTFSVGFNDPLYNESEFQVELCNHLGLTRNLVMCSKDDIYREFQKAVYFAEAPLFRTAPVPMLLLSEKAHDKGIKVVLTGEGSDEVLFGYDIFKEARIRQFWSKQPYSNTRPVLFKRLYQYLPQFQADKFNIAALDFFKRGMEDTLNPLYSHLPRILNCQANLTFLNKSFMSSPEYNDPLKTLVDNLPNNYFDRGPLERCQYLEMKTLLPGYLLSSQGDRMQMANSVEGRFPFLDHNVIEVASKIPLRHKLNGLKDKWVLRELYRKELPESLTNRPKFAYRAPESEAFLSDIDGYVHDLLSEKSINNIGVFNPKSVIMLWDKLKSTSQEFISPRISMAFIQILSTQSLFNSFKHNPLKYINAPKSPYNVVWFNKGKRQIQVEESP